MLCTIIICDGGGGGGVCGGGEKSVSMSNKCSPLIVRSSTRPPPASDKPESRDTLAPAVLHSIAALHADDGRLFSQPVLPSVELLSVAAPEQVTAATDCA
jgi:hypothetical protein